MKIYLPLAATALVAVMTVSCKTNESNYRAAYEAVKEKTDTDSGIEGTIYEKIRKESVSSRTVVGRDTVPTETVAVKCVKGVSVPSDVKPYNIAVAQFKQVFNARAMMERLRADGYKGATVVETAEPLYYVIAVTTDSVEEAVSGYDIVKADKRVFTKTPYPILLKPQRYPLGE
ncbi:SPOR domain-containing protein [uncultured Muribaculum sp.]|uniref:SPOR domain-containing protein n=1 Tax=uncultured Muribaculum sp. TaxID=1918613 RepID=UPI0025CF2B39|nr:SPOR domain-containing protein [uncultured Muribaculum sp.]